MKSFILSALSSLLFSCTFGQFNAGQWNLITGDQLINGQPFYGQKGVESSARPQDRLAVSGWSDKAGNVFLYGGWAVFATDSHEANDMWKLNAQSNRWTWIGGDSVQNGARIYGTLGMGTASTTPGYRERATTWTDSSGKLWLFGGTDNAFYAPFSNDLWKFDPSTNIWTWVKGDSTREWFSVYGTKKVPANSNKPGSREEAMSWTDNNGNLWLLGGIQYNFDTRGTECMNDLWKYNIATNQWTWISGSRVGRDIGVYGTKGVGDPANYPKARSGAVTWKDAAGKFWLYGGYNCQTGLVNDFWKFDPVSEIWTWMGGEQYTAYTENYGTKGVAAISNYPIGREYGTGWTAPNGDLWLFGGQNNANGMYNIKNDIWRYRPSDGLWTWMGGDKTAGPPVYGTKNVPSQANQPGGRAMLFSWTDSLGNLLFFGGTNTSLGNRVATNDTWKYEISTDTWTWTGGETLYQAPLAVFGTKGTAAPDVHPKDFVGYTWKEANGNLALLQSAVIWNFDPAKSQWMWRDGDNSGVENYGVKGVSAPTNSPGTRPYGVSGFTDRNGDFWMFGGRWPYQSNDLWRFSKSSRQWTWIAGSSFQGASGNYGNKGTSTPETTPGARVPAACWLDAAGNYWLFGGSVTQTTVPRYNTARYNDLWKFDMATSEWTWVAGSRSPIGTAVKGTQGVSSPTNTPGSEYALENWTDKNGDLWMRTATAVPELWKFSVATGEWTWVRNEAKPVVKAHYGKARQFSSLNHPGTEGRAIVGLYDNQNQWYYGGVSDGNYFNHIWQKNVNTDEWAWMGGDSIANIKPGSLADGAAGTNIRPGARMPDIAYVDNLQNLWLFGGTGVQLNGIGNQQDTWKFSSGDLAPLPVRFAVVGVNTVNKTNLVHWSTAQEENTHYFVVERSANGSDFLSIGRIESSGFSATTRQYQYTDQKPMAGINFYRVVQFDRNNSSTVSKIVSIVFKQESNGFRIIKNPVQENLIFESALTSEATIEWQILDISGRILLANKRRAGIGLEQHKIDVGHLQVGQYLLILKSKNTLEAIKFLRK